MIKEARIMQRIKFCKDNSKLCKKAFGIVEVKHEHWKYEHGRILIEKARIEVGYSKHTANCDIFWSLLGIYKWMKQNNLLK